jgi:hypothetical protein
VVNDAIPFFEEGDEITCTATAAVNGKRLVAITGDLQADGTLSVAHAGDNARALGVAMWDTAINKRVTVKTLESGNVVPITLTNAAVAAGTPVCAAANGFARAAAAGERAVGVVLTGALANADAMVKLGRQAG